MGWTMAILQRPTNPNGNEMGILRKGEGGDE
jgi:hypothetical protein